MRNLRSPLRRSETKLMQFTLCQSDLFYNQWNQNLKADIFAPTSGFNFPGRDKINQHVQFRVINCQSLLTSISKVDLFSSWLQSKGQLISKCSFGVIVSTKITTNFSRISALASKKRWNRKKSYCYFFFNYLRNIWLGTFLFGLLLEARAEIL